MAKLTAFVLDGHALQIRPAPVERAWMEATHQRYAYRCLPLNIANAHGWEILCPTGFAALWDGKPGKDGVHIAPDAGTSAPAISHFGHGVLTFHIPALFRTESGADMFATGPLNRPKDAIGPLTGIIETDWAPYTFTMNWMFTRPNTPIRFEAGEPFCHIFPLARGAVEAVEPEVRPLSAEPELEALYKQWSTGRDGFNSDLHKPGTEAHRERWQKMYFRGLQPTGEPAPADDHRSRLRVKPFKQPKA